MNYLKGSLNFLTGAFFAVLTALLALLCFSLLVYPTNEYAAVILALAAAFAAAFFLNKLRRRLFKRTPAKKPVYASVITAVLAVTMIAVFWIPTKTFESTGTIVEGYGLEPEYVAIHTGDEIAVYVHKPELPNGEAPVLFISGGPGGYPTNSTKLYLDEYAKLGYTVYTYDPIGCGRSPLPREHSAYSMTHEVEVVNDIMKNYHMEKVNLIASSYGGNVAARFIGQYPEQVNSYLSVDTAPIYSMSENYPGQERDTAFQETVEDTREEASAEEGTSFEDALSYRQMARILYGMNIMSLFGKDDVPYGSVGEYDYMISVLVSSATNSLTEDGRPGRRMNFLSNVLNTKSLETSEDFTKKLKEEATPPVLVVHPEYGIVPWQIHYQYRDYFEKIAFVTAPESGHSVWGSETGKDILVRDGDALFKGEKIPDEYTLTDNPFPPLQK